MVDVPSFVNGLIQFSPLETAVSESAPRCLNWVPLVTVTHNTGAQSWRSLMGKKLYDMVETLATLSVSLPVYPVQRSSSSMTPLSRDGLLPLDRESCDGTILMASSLQPIHAPSEGECRFRMTRIPKEQLV